MRFDRMISAVDAHACGKPGRVIVGGVLDVPEKTMFEKMKYLEADHLRKLMLREPGTTCTGRVVGETSVGPYRAVVPTLSRCAWITGFC